MCGIFGILDFGGEAPIDETRFLAGLELLAHRGPDGRFVRRIAEHVVFGHARLSIIDISEESNQPLSVSDRYWLTYNGEIFNYLELRSELESLGVKFETKGDTEVLLRSYIQWGPDCVNRFNGMWAFAIYDMSTGEIFASRDRFGIKPFNYTKIDNKFIFSSEIKSILHYAPSLADPDYSVIANFCRTSAGAQHEQSWFREVKRLQPGHNLNLSACGAIHIWRYWDYPEDQNDVSFAEAKTKYTELFENAVRLRMRSDVPLGITLSAGIDSTSIAYVMHEIDPLSHYAITAGFSAGEGPQLEKGIFVAAGQEVDEPAVARETARRLGMQFKLVETNYSDFLANLERIIWHLESGNSSPAVVPAMQMLDQAREHMTVVLEGQGADELLGGYASGLLVPVIIDLLSRKRFTDAWQAVRDYRTTYKLRWAFILALRYWSNRWPIIGKLQRRFKGLEAVYGPLLTRNFNPLGDSPRSESRGHDELAKKLFHEHNGGLVNLLHYGDAISMAANLESRMPFLDHRLVEYVTRLPSDYKVRGVLGKYLHRQAMRGRVPDAILDTRVKLGFPTPIDDQFLRVDGRRSAAVQVLLSNRCLERGIFNPTGLANLVEEHETRKARHGTLLYRLLLTELWFRIFIDDEKNKLQ